MRLLWGTVARVLAEEPGVQTLDVRFESSSAGAYPSICYTSLAGSCSAGERVLVNTTAVDLDLGTGSAHFVVAREPGATSRAGGGAALDEHSGGHIMKLRYTPLQHDVLAVEEEASPQHAMMAVAEDLGGMPVICCGLHSQIAHAAAAAKRVVPSARIVYVMTDQAALPLPLSRLVRQCRAAGLLDATVTANQAFGGELEAVTLHSALLAARHCLSGDIAVVSLGPGITGTGTPFGHGGVAQGEALNAAACLGGQPVAALRVSFADERPRHRGVSHHSLTALARVALAPARVALPRLREDRMQAIEESLAEAGVWERHEASRTQVSPDELPDTRGVEVRTMGRGIADDPAFFAAAAASGDAAARLIAP